MHPIVSGRPPKIGVNIGRIERGLGVMGCVLDVVRVLYSVKRGHPERHPRAFLA